MRREQPVIRPQSEFARLREQQQKQDVDEGLMYQGIEIDPKERIDLYQIQQEQGGMGKIPSKNDPEIAASLQLNRASENYKPTGIMAKALKAERIAIGNDLSAINDGQYRNQVSQFIGYIPNSRFTYFNRLARDILDGKKVSACDRDFWKTVWMEDKAKDALVAFLGNFVDNSYQDFVAKPIRGKGRLQPICRNGTLKLALANPGLLDLETGDFAEYDDKRYRYLDDQQIALLKKEIAKNKTKFQTISSLVQNVLGSKTIDDETRETLQSNSKLVDKKLMRVIQGLKKALSDDVVNVEEIMNLFKALPQNNLVVKEAFNYMNSLMNPWLGLVVRPPSHTSTNSQMVSVYNSMSIAANATGNIAGVYQPFAYWQAVNYWSSLCINNNVGLTGLASSNFFLAVQNYQSQPTNVGTKYRLCSAGWRIRTFGSLNTTQGKFRTATVPVSGVIGVAGAAASPNAAFLGDFNQVNLGYTPDEAAATTLADGNGVEQVYYPYDDSYFNPIDIGTEKTGWAMAFYGTQLPPNQAVQIETWAVYEYNQLVTNRNYVPVTVSLPGTLKDFDGIKDALMRMRDTNSLPFKNFKNMNTYIKDEGTLGIVAGILNPNYNYTDYESEQFVKNPYILLEDGHVRVPINHIKKLKRASCTCDGETNCGYC